MQTTRCGRARRRRVPLRVQAKMLELAKRLGEIKPMAVVGDTKRPAEIVDRLIALARYT